MTFVWILPYVIYNMLFPKNLKKFLLMGSIFEITQLFHLSNASKLLEKFI